MRRRSSSTEPGCGPPFRRGYHHGSLRDALVEAARNLLRDHGPEGFSLSDAARQAGVSAAAPYRHFRDRDALLVEVARTGYQLLHERLRKSTEASAPHEAFRAMGLAYLAFARQEPGYYAAMFGRPLPQDLQTQGAADAAFGLLVQGVARALGPKVPAPEALVLLGRQIWALSHGVAALERAGCYGPDPAVADALLIDAVAKLLGPLLDC